MWDEFRKFVDRLEGIGIIIEYWANYPWIYLHKINGKAVTEKFESEHGFVLGYAPRADGYFNFSDTSEIFRIIRKYSK